MRQTLGEKKTKQLAKETGLPIVKVLVRGGTDHRKDLCLEDGSVIHLYKDGTQEKSEFTWSRHHHNSKTAKESNR